MAADLTHDELVRRALRWLRNSRGCKVLVCRASMACMEQPDALGWTGLGWSILVECKVSRADFFRDAKKHFRLLPSLGIGNERFYLTPPCLLTPDEVPEGWGWIECHPGKVMMRKSAPHHSEKNRAEETRHLLALILRGLPDFKVADCWQDSGTGI